MGASDCRRRRLREAVAADLALGDQLRQRTDCLLDRRTGIHPVLIEQVDVVGTESRKRALHREPHILGTAVETPAAIAPVQDRAELGRYDDLVTPAGNGLRKQFLVDVRPVDLCRIEEGHPELDGTMDSADRRVIVERGTGIERTHAHQTEPDSTDLLTCGTEFCLLHGETTFSLSIDIPVSMPARFPRGSG